MKLRDPERPRNERGMLMLMWEGRPVVIVPHLMIYPATDHWHISACVPYAWGISRYYGAIYTKVAPPIYEWELDPENVLCAWGWTWTETRSKAKADMDLDLDVVDILNGLR